MYAIEVDKLVKHYRSEFLGKKILALDGLSFNVEKGKVTGFLGANGAGKTTSIKSILGLLSYTSGSIRFFEESELNKKIKKRIGFLPERPYFYEYLKGEEFLRFYAQLSGTLSKKETNIKIEALLDRVGLAHAKSKSLREYSKGMLQRIGIAQSLIHDPELVILDEPMSGLDPDGRFEVAEIIKEIAASGKTIFFSSHLLHDVEKLSENLIVLKKGELAYQGKLVDLIKSLNSNFTISFIQSGKKQELKVNSNEDLQLKIDEIRKDKLQIISIEENQYSLEAAYVKLNEVSRNE